MQTETRPISGESLSPLLRMDDDHHVFTERYESGRIEAISNPGGCSVSNDRGFGFDALRQCCALAI